MFRQPLRTELKGMIKIRDCVRELIRLQTNDFPDSSIKSETG